MSDHHDEDREQERQERILRAMERFTKKHRARACTKLRYATQDRANRAAEAITVHNALQHGEARVCRAYWCRDCSGWHITSKASRGQQ